MKIFCLVPSTMSIHPPNIIDKVKPYKKIDTTTTTNTRGSSHNVLMEASIGLGSSHNHSFYRTYYVKKLENFLKYILNAFQKIILQRTNIGKKREIREHKIVGKESPWSR